MGDVGKPRPLTIEGDFQATISLRCGVPTLHLCASWSRSRCQGPGIQHSLMGDRFPANNLVGGAQIRQRSGACIETENCLVGSNEPKPVIAPRPREVVFKLATNWRISWRARNRSCGICPSRGFGSSGVRSGTKSKEVVSLSAVEHSHCNKSHLNASR